MHRVQKLLPNYGYCSRRKAEELIAAGRVTVNGKKSRLVIRQQKRIPSQ